MAQRSPNDNIKEPDDEFFDTFFDDGVLETIGEVLGHHNSGTSHDESSCEAQDPSSLGTGGEEINLPQSDTGSNSVGSHADKHHVIVIKPAHIKDPFENLRTEESFKKSATSSREMVLIERPGTSVEMAAPSSNESKNDCERQSTLSLNQLLAKVQNFLKETPGSEIKSSENSNKQVDENHPPVVPNSIEEQGNQVTSEMSEIHNKQLGMEGVVKNAKSTTVFKTKCGSADTELDVNAPTTNQISSSSLSSSPICNVTLSSNDCFDIAPKESLPKTYAVKEKDLSVNGTCLKNDYLQLSPPGKRNKININLKSQILASTSILNSGSSTTSEPQLFSQGNCDEIPSKSHVLYSDMSSTDDSSTENRELKKKKKKRMKGHGDQDIFRNSKSAEKELKSNEAHGKKKKKKRKHSPEQRRNRDHNISSKRQRSRSSEQKNLSRKEYKRGTSPNVSMRNKRQRSPMPNRYSKHKSGSPSRHRSKSPVRHRSRKSPSPRKNRRRSRSRSRSPFINEIRRLEKLWEQEDERKKFSFNPESWTAPSSQVPAWPDGGTTSTAFVSQTVLQMQSATFTIGPLTDRSNPAYQEGSAALIGPGGCHSFPAPPPNFTDSPYAMPPFETFAAHSGVPRMVLQQPEVPGLAPYQSGVPGVTPYPLVCTPPLVPQMVPPPSSIVTSSNNVTGQQSILRRQLDILKSVMPPAPVMPPVTAPPMLPAPVNKLRPSLHEVEINNTQSQKNITCEAVNTESPPLELIGTNCIEISGQCSSKSKSDGIIEKSLPSREGNSNSSSQASAQDIAIETLNDNCSSESHKSRSDILTEKLGVSSNKAIEVPDIPQIMNPMEYENQNEDDEIGVIVEDYDSDIIIEETPPKPPIELICLSEDEGDAILPEACDKEPNKNYKSHEIYPTNEEGTEKTISVDSTPAERACAMTGAPPPAVLVTSVSSGLQTLNQTSEEVTMAKQLIPQVLPIESCQNASSMKQFEPLELQTKNHHRKKRKRSKRSSVEDDEHVGKEKQRESEKLLVSNEDESQESNKNCERHKIHPVNEEIMKEFNEVRSKSTSVEPTSQETSVTLLTPSEVLETPESPISQTFKKASNEINMQKQTSPQVTSKESPNPVICPYGSSMKECESLESQTRKHKKKKRKRRSSEDKTCRRLGKENLEEPMNLSVSNQDESQDSVLRECREMIDSLRIGRFAVKYQDCDESEKTGTFLPKEPTGSNSPLVENIVHFSYTKTLKPESLPKVKDVSTNTIFRLCLDVCTNTDTNVTSKDCILQTDFECHQCIEKKDLIRDMNAQLMKLKKERDDLRAIVVGLGKYHTIPGLDLPSEEAQDNNFHQQSGLEFTSSEREFVENGPSFSSEQTGCNFELMPPAVPIFAYDYNHSSPSRSGVCSKRDSYLCPKKPFQ